MDDKRELASSIGQVEKPEGSSINRGLWAVYLLAWDTFHSLVKSFWNGAVSTLGDLCIKIYQSFLI